MKGAVGKKTETRELRRVPGKEWEKLRATGVRATRPEGRKKQLSVSLNRSREFEHSFPSTHAPSSSPLARL